MRLSKEEEFTRLCLESIKSASLLIIFTVMMLIIGKISFDFIYLLGAKLNFVFATPYILLGILAWLNISTAIIVSVIQIKSGLKRYDEYTNKDWTDKDMDRWCYCSLRSQHKLITHKNDPKFFIQ